MANTHKNLSHQPLHSPNSVSIFHPFYIIFSLFITLAYLSLSTSRHHRPSSSSTNLTAERKSFFTGAVQNPFRGSLVVCVGDLASLGFDGVCAVGEWVVVGLIVGYCGFQMRRTGMVCCGFLFVCEEGIKNDLVLGCRG